jgi:hypothetical protein
MAFKMALPGNGKLYLRCAVGFYQRLKAGQIVSASNHSDSATWLNEHHHHMAEPDQPLEHAIV